MWVYGHTDLTDFYRDRLTLRQVWVRLVALPAEAPVWGVLEGMEERAKEARQVNEIDQALAMFRKG